VGKAAGFLGSGGGHGWVELRVRKSGGLGTAGFVTGCTPGARSTVLHRRHFFPKGPKPYFA
jgi:hypothetical protein